MCDIRSLLTLVAAVILCTGGCGRAATGDDFVPFTTVTHATTVAAEVTDLHVSTQTGEVQVIGGNDDQLRVDAQVKIRKSRSGSAADKGEFKDHTNVEIKDGRLSIADAHHDQSDSNDWRVSFVVHAPDRLATTVNVLAGRISISQMASDMKLDNKAGEVVVKADKIGGVTASTEAGNVDIEAGMIGGPVDASVTVGNVTLTVTETAPAHDVRLAVETGRIELALPKGVAGTFTAKTEVGAIEVSGHDGLTVTRSGLGATVQGNIGTGGPTYDLSVKVGAVTIR